MANTTYTRDYLEEKACRDAKIGAIHEGVSNLPLQTIATGMLSRRMQLPRWFHRFVLTFAATLLGACDNTQEPQEPQIPTQIQVSPATWSLSEGSSRQFIATIRDQSGEVMSGTSVVWRSDHPELVTVDASGLAAASKNVLGALVAEVSISATAGALSANAEGTVTRAGQFDVWPDTSLLYAGMTRPLLARLIRSFSGHLGPDLDTVPNTKIAWSTSDPAVASVNSAGLVTAVAPGHARLTAKWIERAIDVEVYVVTAPSAPLRFTSITSSSPVVGATFAPAYGARACGVATDGSIYCWGHTMDTTQISDRCEAGGPGGAPGFRLFRIRCSEVPLRLQTEVKFTAVAIGDNFDCGLATTKRVHCWGSNAKGQLGLGTTDATMHGVAAIAGNDEFFALARVPFQSTTVCGIRTDSVLRCWGDSFGPSPVTVGAGLAWRTLTGSGGCGLATDSTAYCITSGTPTPVGGSARWKSIAVNDRGSLCALALDDGVYCGANLDSRMTLPEPVVQMATYWDAIYSDLGAHGDICGLTATGDLRCFGNLWEPVGVPLKFRSFYGYCAIAVDERVYCRHGKAGPWIAALGQ